MSLQFGGYTLRATTEADRALADEWIAADPFHRDTTTADFFLGTEPGSEAFVLEDAEGKVFFIRLTRAMRIDIQFSPPVSIEARERTRDALTVGVEWLADALAKTGCRELIFESQNPALIRASEKRLGFRRSPGELVRAIGPAIVAPGPGTDPEREEP